MTTKTPLEVTLRYYRPGYGRGEKTFRADTKAKLDDKVTSWADWLHDDEGGDIDWPADYVATKAAESVERGLGPVCVIYFAE